MKGLFSNLRITHFYLTSLHLEKKEQSETRSCCWGRLNSNTQDPAHWGSLQMKVGSVCITKYRESLRTILGCANSLAPQCEWKLPSPRRGGRHFPKGTAVAQETSTRPPTILSSLFHNCLPCNKNLSHPLKTVPSPIFNKPSLTTQPKQVSYST